MDGSLNPCPIGVKQLRWQCRRGMLELDYLLEGFLEQYYEGLSAAQQQRFIELLRYTDPELQRWLILGDEPANLGLVPMIQLIRATVGLA